MGKLKLKLTTKSAKITTSHLIMISQYKDFTNCFSQAVPDLGQMRPCAS